jgi:hypothetical protein
MNENSPIWASATATDRLVANGYRISHVMMNVASGLPIIMTATVPPDKRRTVEQGRRVEQHPDGNEEQYSEGVPKRAGRPTPHAVSNPIDQR